MDVVLEPGGYGLRLSALCLDDPQQFLRPC